MFYENDEPEGKFLYTETVKLYCTVLYEAGSIILKFLKSAGQILGANQYKTERKRRWELRY